MKGKVVLVFSRPLKIMSLKKNFSRGHAGRVNKMRAARAKLLFCLKTYCFFVVLVAVAVVVAEA